MDDEKIMIVVGFLIVIVVALNVLLVFTNFFKLGSGLNVITGFATNECQNTVGGVNCGNIFYPIKPASASCTGGLVAVCTNACQIARAQTDSGNACPAYCTDICIPSLLSDKILLANNH